MGVLGEIERRVGAGEGGFQIAQEGMDGPERLQLHAGGTTAGDGALMRGAGCRDGLTAPQSIGNHMSRRTQRLFGPLGDRVPGELQLGQAGKQRVAGFGRLHGGDEGHLVLRTTAALATGQLATPVGVVDLDATIELARFFALTQNLHPLVLDQPGRFVAHPQVAFEFQG